MTRIDFRPLIRKDFPALRRWLNTPHVYEWWGRSMGAGALGGAGRDAATAAEVEAKYGPDLANGGPTHRYIIEADGQSVGLIQWYRLADFTSYARDIGERPDGAAGIDLFVGEKAAIGQGLGSRAIDEFASSVVFVNPDVDRLVTGPATGNARSIRCFEKAGFQQVRSVSVPGEPAAEIIMVRRRG